MKKLLVLILVLISLSTIVFSDTIIHCWNISANVGTANATIEGCAVPGTFTANGSTYNWFALPGSYIYANNFGNYNIHCDNGADEYAQNFGVLYYNSTIAKSNSAAGGAMDSGRRYCEWNGSTKYLGDNIGYGNLADINYAITSSILGGNSFQLDMMNKPIAGTYSASPTTVKSAAIFVGTPSLLILSPSELRENFYDKYGDYNKEIFFTIMNKSPLINRINSINVTCSDNVTCWTEDNYNGWDIEANNGVMIISTKAKISKSALPTTFTITLDVNYSPKNFSGKLECTQNYSTSSLPTTVRLGLLDSQDFQVKLKSDYDQFYCIGENGMIGQTGEAYAPRVNLTFGGATGSENQIDIFECDPKDANTLDNNDWVYCSQKEFLVELAEKIGKIADIKEEIASLSPSDPQRTQKKESLELLASKYANAQSSLRKFSLNSADVNAAAKNIKDNPTIFANLGLGTYNFGKGCSSASCMLSKFYNLYNNNGVEFNISSVQSGLYQISIDLNSLNDYSSDYYLFNQQGELQPNVDIKVTITPISPPTFDWFFYEYGDIDITNSSVQYVQSPGNDYYLTNVTKRGIALEFTESANTHDFNDAKVYKTYAVPLFSRIVDRNGVGDTNMSINSNVDHDAFTYWTGFASTKGSGCETTALGSTDTFLPYRLPDTKKQYTGSQSIFYLPELNNLAQNSKMYLETSLFLPIGNSMTLTAPFRIYNKSNYCDGNSQQACTFTVTDSLKSSSFSNLQELFDRIKSEYLCVYQGVSNGKGEWSVFWNQQKLYKDLNTMKATITDANICTAREIV